MLFAGKISVTVCVVNLVNVLLVSGLLCVGVYWTLKEKTPHYNDISMVTKENLSDNWRKFAVNLLTVVAICMSGLFLTMAGLLWLGYSLPENPAVQSIYRMFGESKPVVRVLPWEYLDLIISIFSLFLFLYIIRCKAIRNIIDIKVVR